YVFHGAEHWYADFRATANTYGDQTVPVDSLLIYDYAVHLHRNRLRNTAGQEFALSSRIGYRDNQTHAWLTASSNWMQSGFFANAHGLEPRYVDEAVFDASSRDIDLPNQRVMHAKLAAN